MSLLRSWSSHWASGAINISLLTELKNEPALMNFIAIKLKTFAVTLLLCTSAVTPSAFGQQRQRLSKDELISAALEIITTARYCALITVDAKGRVHARTMDPFLPDENMMIWFGTNPSSRKVAEIRRHLRVQ